MRIVFSPEALADQRYFKEYAPKTAEKIKQLVANILDTPFSGLGKPEPLKHGLQGYWSRRIDREHRLVYRVAEDAIWIISCRYHY